MSSPKVDSIFYLFVYDFKLTANGRRARSCRLRHCDGGFEEGMRWRKVCPSMDLLSGLRIHVHPGVYKESLVITRDVEIVGTAPPAECVLLSSGSNCIRFSAKEVSLMRLAAVTQPGALGKPHPLRRLKRRLQPPRRQRRGPSQHRKLQARVRDLGRLRQLWRLRDASSQHHPLLPQHRRQGLPWRCHQLVRKRGTLTSERGLTLPSPHQIVDINGRGVCISDRGTMATMVGNNVNNCSSDGVFVQGCALQKRGGGFVIRAGGRNCSWRRITCTTTRTAR